MRSTARSAVLVGVVVFLTVPLLWSITHCVDRGRWCCAVCGALEERVTLGGWTLCACACTDSEDTDCASAPSLATWKRFESWYWTAIGAPHEHDWIPIGCHWNLTHDTVGCHLSYGQAYFRAMPHLPNPETAIWMARRVVRADPIERYELRRPMSLLPSTELFGSLARSDSMSRAEFDEAFARWQGEHPEWR